MTKNTAKIVAGLQALARKPPELVHGTVVAGSYDDGERTVSVVPSGKSTVIRGVLLSSINGEQEGITAVPKDNSSVIIGCVDGPGLWCVVKYGELEKAIVKIGAATCTITETKIEVTHGNSSIEVGSLLKLNTASESLHTLLSDLISAISMITVPTPAGTSGPPVNIGTFSTISTRISNLLSA